MFPPSPLLRVAACFLPPQLGFEYRPSPGAHRRVHLVPFAPAWGSLPASVVESQVLDGWPAEIARPSPRQLRRMILLLQRVCLCSREEVDALRRENVALRVALAARTPLPGCAMSGGMASRVSLRRPRPVHACPSAPAPTPAASFAFGSAPTTASPAASGAPGLALPTPPPRAPAPTPCTSLCFPAAGAPAPASAAKPPCAPTPATSLAIPLFPPPLAPEAKLVSTGVWRVGLDTCGGALRQRQDEIAGHLSGSADTSSSSSFPSAATPTSPSMVPAASPVRCDSPTLEQFVRRAPAVHMWQEEAGDAEERRWRQVSRSASPAVVMSSGGTQEMRRSSPAGLAAHS